MSNRKKGDENWENGRRAAIRGPILLWRVVSGRPEAGLSEDKDEKSMGTVIEILVLTTGSNSSRR